VTGPEPSTQQRPRRRGRPSLATVIALLALIVALGTGAEALPGRNTVKTDDIAKGAVTTPKIKKGAVTPAKIKDHAMWALVDTDGTVLQSSGVVSVTRSGAGIYFVVFSRGVVLRPLVATVYNEGSGAGQVNVRHCTTVHPAGLACEGGESLAKILVNTEDSAGANADRRFLVTALAATPGVTTAAPLRAHERVGPVEGR
jgi:hypothetical protein